jgi:hypothetical protein
MKRILFLIVFVFVPGLVWGQRIFDVTAHPFNAKPGTTVNTVALQKAIDSAGNHPGSFVYFPEGTFLSGKLTLRPDIGLVASGKKSYADRSGILKYTGTHGNFLTLAADPAHPTWAVHGVEIMGLTVDGNNTDSAAIYLCSMRSQITDCAINNAGMGIWFDGRVANPVFENGVQNCFFNDDSISIYATGSHATDSWVRNCIIAGTTLNTPTRSHFGIKVPGFGWDIAYNHIYYCDSAFVDMSGAQYQITHNIFDGVLKYGVNIHNPNGGAAGAIISNNAFTPLPPVGDTAICINIVNYEGGIIINIDNNYFHKSGYAGYTRSIVASGSGAFYGQIFGNMLTGGITDYETPNADRLDVLAGSLRTNAAQINVIDSGTKIVWGANVPENSISAYPGSIFSTRWVTDTTKSPGLFLKSGVGSTGWSRTYTDTKQISFYPTATGWYRLIADSIGGIGHGMSGGRMEFIGSATSHVIEGEVEYSSSAYPSFPVQAPSFHLVQTRFNNIGLPMITDIRMSRDGKINFMDVYIIKFTDTVITPFVFNFLGKGVNGVLPVPVYNPTVGATDNATLTLSNQYDIVATSPKFGKVVCDSILFSSGTAMKPSAGNVDFTGGITLTNALLPISGGTGVSTLHGLVVANNTSPFTAISATSGADYVGGDWNLHTVPVISATSPATASAYIANSSGGAVTVQLHTRDITLSNGSTITVYVP